MLGETLDAFAMLPFVDETPAPQAVVGPAPASRMVELSEAERSELLAFARLAEVMATAHARTPEELSGALREIGWEDHPGFRIGDPVTGLIAVACRHQKSGRLALAFGIVPECHTPMRELQVGMSGEVPSAAAQAGALALLARTCHGADVTLVGTGVTGSMASYAGFTAGLPVVTSDRTELDAGMLAALSLSGRMIPEATSIQRHLLAAGSPSEQMYGRCLVFDCGGTALAALMTDKCAREFLLVASHTPSNRLASS